MVIFVLSVRTPHMHSKLTCTYKNITSGRRIERTIERRIAAPPLRGITKSNCSSGIDRHRRRQILLTAAASRLPYSFFWGGQYDTQSALAAKPGWGSIARSIADRGRDCRCSGQPKQEARHQQDSYQLTRSRKEEDQAIVPETATCARQYVPMHTGSTPHLPTVKMQM